MSLTILKDEEIAALLNVMTVGELESFRSVLKQALYEYSTGTQGVKDGEIQQPPRVSVTSPVTGGTTLFMPSCSTDGIGMKVITLTKAQKSAPPREGAAAPASIRPTGALTLYSATGSPIGILHASTLTAFRTALASACLLVRRDTVKNMTVFGCGEQAYWHVRLALLLRGSTVRHVNIISRRFDAARAFIARFYRLPQAVKEREGWATGTKFSILTTSYNEYARLLTDDLRSSDVIFCCTPSTEPLFDHRILTNHEGRRKGRLIVAIGSYTHEMRELPTELLRQATKVSDRNHVHYHNHAVEGGVVVVDTLDGAIKEAGEIAEAGLTPRSLVELGELVMLARVALKEDDVSEDASVSSPSASASGGSSGELNKLAIEQMSLGGGPAAASDAGGQDTPTVTFSSSSSTTTPSSPTPTASGFFASESPAGPAGAPHHGRPPSRKSSGGSLLRSLTPGHSSHRRSSSQAAADQRKKKEDQSARWLQRGNVIYKSVGLGLMDLSVGLHLIEFAREKNVGTRIDGF